MTSLSPFFDRVQSAETVAELAAALLALAREASKPHRASIGEAPHLATIAITARKLRGDLFSCLRGTTSIKSEIEKLRRSNNRTFRDILTSPMSGSDSSPGPDAIKSINLHRRHLNESQRGMIADRVARLPKHIHRKVTDTGIPVSEPQKVAAKRLNISTDTVQQARLVRNQGIHELQGKVESRDLKEDQRALQKCDY